MLKLIYTYIKSLFTPTDITLTLNGSQLIFTKEGDVKVTGRSFIMQTKYIFENCSDSYIEKRMLDPNYQMEELCLEQSE